VLVPVYNVAAYLQQCICSIQQQMPEEGVEVILLDDASTDHSRELCVEICATFGNFRLMTHERNMGLSAARNSLLAAASGKYIWFVDSDDEMLPGAIARLREVANRHSPDIILCDYRKLGQDCASFIGPEGELCTDREALIRGIFSSRRIYAWSRIARRELWGSDLRFPVGRCFEDIMTTPWLCLRARSFYYVSEPWISYRVREGSITAIALRSPDSFDESKNDDLASALAGFHVAAHAAIPDMSERTRKSIGEFCARACARICWRLLRAQIRKTDWQTIVARMQRYRATMENCSPVPFNQLPSFLLRQGKATWWLKLKLLLLLTRPEAGSRSSELITPH
jgi:glycosyltransferase involved in cell wall biosynthesis